MTPVGQVLRSPARGATSAAVERTFVAAGMSILLAILGSGCDAGAKPSPKPKFVIDVKPAVAPALPPLPAAARRVRFTECAAERGLTYRFPEQPRPMRALDSFGAGCAIFDADDDGWQDVLLLADPWPMLYRNDQTGQFIDVSPLCGLWDIEPGDWTGCAIGDYDGDGRLDALLTGYHRLALLRNEGCFAFSDVTAAAGLSPQNHNHWGASAGWMDLDGDRYLDLVFLNYVAFGPDSRQYCEHVPGVRTGCSPREYPAEFGEIWKNLGGELLERVPFSQGMGRTSGAGLVLAFADLDGDGRPDCYLGNDGVEADLLHNRGDMHFENIAVVAGVAGRERGGPLAAMGADWGDFDRDGALDLTVTDWNDEGFAVFRQMAPLMFEDQSGPLGINAATRQRLGFGAKWVDMDNDGWLDVSYVNGHVYDSIDRLGRGLTLKQPSSLFWSREGRSFTDLVPHLGPEIGKPILGRGSATGDFDNDGRTDLLLIDFEGPPLLLKNQTETSAHWLLLDLRESAPNVFAYGAMVTGKTGDRRWLAQVSPASSYLSSSDPRVHFGLGGTSHLETLTVRWSSGREQVFENVAADRILRIREGDPALYEIVPGAALSPATRLPEKSDGAHLTSPR